MSLDKFLQIGKSKTDRELPLNLQIMKLTKNKEEDVRVVVHVEKEAKECYGWIIHGGCMNEKKLPERLTPFVEKWNFDVKDIMEGTASVTVKGEAIATAALREGAIVAWFSEGGAGHAVPFILRTKPEVDTKIEYGILKRHLNLKYQKNVVHINTSYGHHDNLGKCQRRVITENVMGKVIGIRKRKSSSSEEPERKRQKTEGCDDMAKEGKMAMCIAKQLVEWFRQVRLDYLLANVAMSPKHRMIRTSAERWVNDTSHTPPDEYKSLLKDIAVSKKMCKDRRELVSHNMKKELQDANKRLLVAFKYSWKNSSSDNEPPLNWQVYDKHMQTLKRYIDSLDCSIPGDMGISINNPVNWGDLVVMYSIYGDSSIERAPMCGGEEKARALMSRIVPNGKWESGMNRSDEEVECVQPGDAHDYHIVMLRDSMQVRLQDLDEVRRTKGQHLLGATKVELVGYQFRFEGRKGAAGFPITIPCAYDSGKYKLILCRLWSHLNDISDDESSCISAWSPLHARRMGISNTGKQHTIEHDGSYVRQGIGQPTLDQSQMLMDASTIQLACRIDDSLFHEIQDLASQIRCIYALMGIIVNTSSHYAKRRLASGKVADYAIKRKGIGSLVSRKKDLHKN